MEKMNRPITNRETELAILNFPQRKAQDQMPSQINCI